MASNKVTRLFKQLLDNANGVADNNSVNQNYQLQLIALDAKEAELQYNVEAAKATGQLEVASATNAFNRRKVMATYTNGVEGGAVNAINDILNAESQVEAAEKQLKKVIETTDKNVANATQALETFLRVKNELLSEVDA
jgi:hypothetical protein